MPYAGVASLDMSDLLAAYDNSLRTEVEMHGAHDVARIGPLWLGTFPGGRGFISYRDLAGADLETLAGLAVAHFDQKAMVTEVWQE